MILTLKLPMQGPLKYINSYLIKTNDNGVLIDTGLPTQEDMLMLTNYLKNYGFPKIVIVTHYHPDHIGLVRLFKDSLVIIHEKELEYINYLIDDGYENKMKKYFILNGFPEDIVNRIFRNKNRFYEIINGVNFTTIKDNEEIKVDNEERIKVLWTPGHTMGHICLQYKDYLFCGDHILPDVTPNVSLLREEDNPLRNYLTSLERIKELKIKQIYPAHGDPFSNVSERIEEIKEHHRRRLEEILKIIERKGKANGYEIAMNISWYKKWDELSNFDKQLAMGETLAHIKYLLEEGIIKEIKVNNSIYYTKSS